MTKQFFISSIFITLFYVNLKAQLPYQNKNLAIEKRVVDLLGRMTIEEKAGQLNQINGGQFTGPASADNGQKEKMEMAKQGLIGSMLNVVGTADTKAAQQAAMQSRLGIPLLFGYDVIHGYKTIFPIPLAEACSWDMAQIQKNSAIAAKEAASAGIHWTFAPMCDISNDPRWGRIMEGAGEDPYLGAKIAAARVIGLQGNFDNNHVLACVKHFAVYGAVEAGREYNTVDVSRVQLWNKYLPPYKGAIDAGAATVMNAFNIYEGVAASANKYLVTDVLKKRLGFKGFLVSDWASFHEIEVHGNAANGKEAAYKAIQAGSQMDMESKLSYKYIPELIKEGKVTVKQLDDAITKILYYKFKLGLFDNAYKFNEEGKESNTLFTTENRIVARTAAAGSVILLKNNENILPLNTTTKIALIGFYANSKDDMFDFWIGQGDYKNAVTFYEGLKLKYNSVTFANGYNPDNTSNQTLINEAVQNANSADVVIVNIGISGKMAGEDRALSNPSIAQGQLDLLSALKKTGKKIIAIVSSARPLILTQAEPLVDAMLQGWILGTEHGNALTDIISGAVNPTAKTVVTFPYAVGQIPIYYNHFNTGRPEPTDGMGNWYSRYRDVQNEPLYPFGYGLSYSTYKYSGLALSANVITKSQTLKVTINLQNTSSVDGEETVQLYIRDYAASIVRPVKELKAFNKIKIKAGETIKVTFTLTAKDLSFYDADGNTLLEPGKFSVFVGANSVEVTKADFELK